MPNPMHRKHQEPLTQRHNTPPKEYPQPPWLVGVLGLIAGLLLVYVPSLAAVSKSIFLFAAFHLVGGAVVLVFY